MGPRTCIDDLLDAVAVMAPLFCREPVLARFGFFSVLEYAEAKLAGPSFGVFGLKTLPGTFLVTALLTALPIPMCFGVMAGI